MKQIILSKENNLNLKDISDIPNYSLNNISVLYSYKTDVDVLRLLSELDQKITIKGTLTLEILDLKLAAQHYLSGSITEQEFLVLCQSFSDKTVDVTELISILKNKEDVVVKNILQNNYVNVITLERQSIL